MLTCCGCVCLTAAGKSTFVRLLQGASEEWEVIPEPVGKWCSVHKDGDDICQVNMYNTIVDCRAALLCFHLYKSYVFIYLMEDAGLCPEHL